METRLEHVNLTVADPQVLADFLCRVFDWTIRWQGSAIHGGHTVHVGGKDSYLAIYGGRPGVNTDRSFRQLFSPAWTEPSWHCGERILRQPN